MNVSKMNLNLLTALDALLTERNVTRAGNKMFITQSAMSNVLKQLRDIFQDELLVQTGRTMTLTLRAQELHPQVRQLLSQAEIIFNPKQFDPSTSQRVFTLGMEEYAAYMLLPSLYAYLHQHAPYIEIRVKQVPLFGEKPLLDAQEIDLAIGLLQKDYTTQGISHELLFRDRIVCIANAKNPFLKGKLTLERYLAAKHVSFLPNNANTPHIVDTLLENMGYKRNIVLRIGLIVPGLYTIAKSDVIATVPEGLAREAKRLLNLVIKPCPFPIPDVAFVQLWHPWTQLDSGCQWLRSIVSKVAQQL